MPLSPRSVLFAVLLLVGTGSPAAAQLIPGGDPSDVASGRRHYLTEVFRGVNAVVTRWVLTWETDDPRTVADFFTDDVLLSPVDGAPAQGKRPAREAVAKLLPVASDFKTVNVDFTASGDMAYYLGRFTRLLTRPGEQPESQTGTFVMVLTDRNGDWRIRSYVEKLDPAAPGAAAAADSAAP